MEMRALSIVFYKLHKTEKALNICQDFPDFWCWHFQACMCSFEVKCINLAWRSRCHPELLYDTFWSLWRYSLIIIAGHKRPCEEHSPMCPSRSREMAPPGSLVTTSFATAFCYGCNVPIFLISPKEASLALVASSCFTGRVLKCHLIAMLRISRVLIVDSFYYFTKIFLRVGKELSLRKYPSRIKFRHVNFHWIP